MGVVVLVVLVGTIGFFAQAGIFYQTGHQWFESCWTLKNAKRDPSTPQEAIAWKQCEPLAKKAIFEAGFAYAGDPENAITPAAKALAKACPSAWSDIPIFGLNQLAVRLAEEDGGPRLTDRFLPAENLISRAFLSRWPTCPSVRAVNEFPSITRQGDEWRWSGPCKPCDAEVAAHAAGQEKK